MHDPDRTPSQEYLSPPPALHPESLHALCHVNCAHCVGSQLTWKHLPPIPTCMALRQLLQFAANDLPLSLEMRMFLYLDIDEVLSPLAATLPQLCPALWRRQF